MEARPIRKFERAGRLVLAKPSQPASIAILPRFLPSMAAPRWRRRPRLAERILDLRRLLPNDVRVTVEQSLPGSLSMDDWQTMKEVIEAVRHAIPGRR